LAINLKVGEKIPLAILLETRVTDKFVRAIVRGATGAEIVGSPFGVPHVSNGWHYDDTVLMPDTAYLTVEYDVFADALFTTSTDLLPDHERFDRDDLASAIDTLLASSQQGTIKAIVLDADDISSKVSDDDSIGATLQDDNALKAKVSDDEQISGKVGEDDSLTGQVDC